MFYVSVSVEKETKRHSNGDGNGHHFDIPRFTTISTGITSDELPEFGKVKSAVFGVIQLWYVKRLDYSFAAVEAAAKKRILAATKKALGGITSLPGDATPPTIPGIVWSHIGGYPQHCDTDEKETWYPSDLGNGHAWLRWLRWDWKVENAAVLVAHVEGINHETGIGSEDSQDLRTA